MQSTITLLKVNTENLQGIGGVHHSHSHTFHRVHGRIPESPGDRPSIMYCHDGWRGAGLVHDSRDGYKECAGVVGRHRKVPVCLGIHRQNHSNSCVGEAGMHAQAACHDKYLLDQDIAY